MLAGSLQLPVLHCIPYSYWQATRQQSLEIDFEPLLTFHGVVVPVGTYGWEPYVYDSRINSRLSIRPRNQLWASRTILPNSLAVKSTCNSC